MTQDDFTPTDDDRPVVPDESDPEAPADDINREEPVPDEDRTVLGFEDPEDLHDLRGPDSVDRP